MAKAKKPQPLIVNQKKAAELLGVTPITVARWRAAGRIRALPQFKAPKYSVAELERMINSTSTTQEAA